MLQQALALALFPEHEVKSVSEIPEPSESERFDVMIVDAVSLGDVAAASRKVQSWKIPTVWVESDAAGQVPRREKLVSIRAPVEKNALQSALTECLGGASKSKASDVPFDFVKATEGGAEPAFAETDLIELVDVVEESTDLGTTRSRQKKSK